MINYRSRTADLLYTLMVNTDARKVKDSAVKIMDAIQDDRVENQVLGLAACLVIMLNHYDLNHSDILGIADNIVYSGESNNMIPEFKAIRRYMKDEWQIA